MSALEVRTHKSLAELAPLASQLDELNDASMRPSPFGTFAYLRDYVTYDEDGAPAELLLVTFWRDGALAGFLPLVRRVERFFGTDYVRLAQVMTGDADRPQLVCRASDSRDCAQAAYTYLCNLGEPWDMLELSDQDATSPMALPPSWLRERGFHARVFPTDPNTTIPLAYANLRDYFRAIDRKLRTNVARNVRRLFQSGEVRWLFSDDPEVTRSLLPHYLDLERRSWKMLGGGVISRHERRLAFFEALAGGDHAPRLRLALGVVVVDGLPIAGMLAGIFGEQLYGFQTAFDEAYAELGPGQLVLLLIVGEAIARGLGAVNLMHGSTHYKERWLAESTPCFKVEIFRRGTAPYVRSRLGLLRHLGLSAAAVFAPAGAYNPAKRKLEGQGVILPADPEPMRRAFCEHAATLPSHLLLSPQALAAALPFSVQAAAPGRARRTLPRGPRRLTPVAVFDADSPPALAMTRSLGRAGIPVRVFGQQRLAVAGLSRYAGRYERCPDPGDDERFIPWLEAALGRGDLELIAPTSDCLAYSLALVHDKLSPAMRRVVPSPQASFDALFKDRFASACAAVGQPTPWSLCPTSREEALAHKDRLPYPLVIKPRSHVGVGLARGVVVKDAQELEARYAPYVESSSTRAALLRHPELRWPMLQEYVPGALANLYSVSGIIDPDGMVVAVAASKKGSQWPPTLGIGTSFEAVDDAELIARGVAVSAGLLGRGLFELELIRDQRTQELVAIDLNPRAYGQMSLDIARGNDLPLLWYRLTQGGALAPQPHPRSTVRWVHSIPYGIERCVRLVSSPWGTAAQPRQKSGIRVVDVIHDSRDVLPSVLFTMRMLRHPGGLLRPFIQEAGTP